MTQTRCVTTSAAYLISFVQIGLVSAHFFKVFFESYWLLGYSVIRSEPPKKFKPQGFQFFYEREINLRCKLFSEKICPWQLVILVIRLLVCWDWVVVDQLEEAGPENSRVLSYLVIWWIVIHVPLPPPPTPERQPGEALLYRKKKKKIYFPCLTIHITYRVIWLKCHIWRHRRSCLINIDLLPAAPGFLLIVLMSIFAQANIEVQVN